MSIISCAWFEPLIKVAVVRSLHRTYVWGDNSPAVSLLCTTCKRGTDFPQGSLDSRQLGKVETVFPLQPRAGILTVQYKRLGLPKLSVLLLLHSPQGTGVTWSSSFYHVDFV